MNFALLYGQLVTGVVAGAGYAVVAVGLSYTLGLARVMNFAFGTFYMVAAFAVLVVMTRSGAAYAVAGVAAIAATTALAWVFSRFIVLPAMKISESSVMIATLGAGVVITNLAQAAFGADVSFIASPLLDTTWRFGPASVTAQSLMILVAAPVITGGLVLFMTATHAGKRIRAVAEAPGLASATGMRVGQYQALAATIGVALAALAAVLYAPVGVVSVFMGDDVLLKAFAVAAFAGVGRIWGALVIGLAIGLFEALVTGFLSPTYSTAAVYLLLVGTLILFPRGIFRGY